MHEPGQTIMMEVQFTCELCGAYVVRPLQIMADFFLPPESFPEGWRVSVDETAIRCWCSAHTKDAGQSKITGSAKYT
jgi:hypothetical protein